MTLTGLEASIVGVVVGAIIGFVPSYLTEIRRERSQLRLNGTGTAGAVPAYAVREVSEGRPDPRKEDFLGQSPHQRFGNALQDFYIAARKQLQVINPGVITPRDLEVGRDPSTRAMP